MFSPDGRYVFGSAYLTGVSNIFRYEIATKQLEAVTNAETGFFNPIPISNDELIVFRYTGEGFVPSRVTVKPMPDLGSITFLGERTVNKHEALKKWEVGSASSIPLETMPQTTRAYHLSGGLKLESLYPIVQGYKDTAAVGMRLDLSDPLRLNNADISVSVSPERGLPARERVHVSANYERYDWHAHGTWNDADFYDLFGPTKRSRKGYSIGVGRGYTLIYDEPKRLDLEVNGRFAGNLDQLPRVPERPRPRRQVVLAERRPQLRVHARLARRGGRGEGPEGVAVVPRRLRELIRVHPRAWDVRRRVPSLGPALIGLAPERRGLLAAEPAASRSPISFSAASATTTSTTCPKSNTAITTASRERA